MDATLDTLLGTPATVTVGGRQYAMRKLTVRDVPFVSRLLRDVWEELVARPDLLGNKDAMVGWLVVRLPSLIETKIEPMLAVLARQTGTSADELGELPLDQFIELAMASLEELLDFFSRQVLPVMEKAKAKFAAGGGTTSSPPSSPPGTAAPTSPATP